MSSQERIETVDERANGMRTDRFISEVLELFPRSQIEHRSVVVRVNGAPAKLSRKLRTGETVAVSYDEPQPSAIAPEQIDLDILFEDDNVVVMNKPRGMVVHPGAGNRTHTLAQGLLWHVRGLADRFNDAVRPGIVHRLDKDTTGVIIAAKHPEALRFLAAQFAARTTEKHYLAIVRSRPRRVSGAIETPIARDPGNRQRFATGASVTSAGKPAVTRYRVVGSFDGISLLDLRPETGRTHQLRVHLASIKCPIVGDAIYGRVDSRFPDAPLLLHARSLRIVLPGESEPRLFMAPLPADFSAFVPADLEIPAQT